MAGEVDPLVELLPGADRFEVGGCTVGMVRAVKRSV